MLSTGKKKRLASQFNFTYRYIDDELSINNPYSDNYLGQMYPAELEIKDTTESNTFASYLDLLLSIKSDGQMRTILYDKRDDFKFHITNFPFLSSNIPSSPAYGVFISQLIRYARACSSYECFILRAAPLSSKLFGQGYVIERLKSSLRKIYGRYGDLIKHYEVSLSQIPDSMTMLGQRWPMVVRARWPNIIKKVLAQCNFAHRPYVRPTRWFYVGSSCWPNNKPTCRPYVGPTFAHGCTCTLAQHHKKGVGPMLFCSSALRKANALVLRRANVRGTTCWCQRVGPKLGQRVGPTLGQHASGTLGQR